MEKEIRVKEVIIRIYNKNPSIYIKEKLNNFILDIATELHSVAVELFKLKQSKDEEGSPH